MKTTIDMAREAGGDDWGLFKDFMPEIERLVALVRADEREACAKEADKWSKRDELMDQQRAQVAAMRGRIQ